MKDYQPIQIMGGKLIPPTITQQLPLKGIPSRGISEETCKRYHTYGTTTPLQVLHQYYKPLATAACGYKLRKGGWTVGEKEVSWFKGSERSLFGLHLWEGEQTDVYLCEGETDAMALSQNVDDGLCLALGGQPTDKQWAEWLDLLHTICGGGILYLAFDNDEQGAKYNSAVTGRYKGRIQLLHLPQGVKDVAEALLDDIELEWTDYVYELPPNILTGEELIPSNSILERTSLTTGHIELDSLVGGFNPGGMIVLAGNPKAGKSTFTADLATKFIKNHGSVLYVPLELSANETMMVLGALNAGIPLSEIDPDRLKQSMAELAPHIYMARHFGHIPIEELDVMLRCIPHIGAKLLVIDHITAAATSFTEGLTTRLLDAMLSLIQARVNEYGIPAVIVTHVNGSGGTCDIHTPNTLRGSMSLAQLAEVVLGIRLLESGLSEVYTITTHRFTGKQGRVTLEFNGSFQAISKRTTKL
jgi:DnaB-like helicase C terminal domain/Toprim-like